jgi:pseudaminic acid biosynthesis-associated methylase
MSFRTTQEAFWAGEFGDEYSIRNNSEGLEISNEIMFSQILRSTSSVRSIVELGFNIGLNLKALKKINTEFDLCGYEINTKAYEIAQKLNIAVIRHGSILNKWGNSKKYDISLTKRVLIHINPEELEKVYLNLYELSNRYIVICEYYNPTPVTVEYRGNKDKLFKRDFAGEMIDKYKLKLVDYGFVYHRHNYFPQDDATWFVLEK